MNVYDDKQTLYDFSGGLFLYARDFDEARAPSHL